MQMHRQFDDLECKQEFAEPSRGVWRRDVILQSRVRQPVVQSPGYTVHELKEAPAEVREPGRHRLNRPFLHAISRITLSVVGLELHLHVFLA